MTTTVVAGPPNMQAEFEDGKPYLWWGEEVRELVSGGNEIVGDTAWSPEEGLTIGISATGGPPFMDSMRESDLRALIGVCLKVLASIETIPEEFRK